ncbi:MAG: hypothetical protein KBA55_14490, partial [Ruminococcus sp.]|nr:hypothetical protein [Ruminococcus sp.]
NKLMPRENEKREKWHNAAMKKLEKSEIVFLDPDNGLLCRSVRKGAAKSVKYTYYSEVNDYLKEHKAVIIYNHRSRKKESDYFNEILSKLCEETEAERDLIQVVTFRRFSVRDYFIISKDVYTHEAIRELIASLLKCSNNKPFFIILNYEESRRKNEQRYFIQKQSSRNNRRCKRYRQVHSRGIPQKRC